MYYLWLKSQNEESPYYCDGFGEILKFSNIVDWESFCVEEGIGKEWATLMVADTPTGTMVVMVDRFIS